MSLRICGLDGGLYNSAIAILQEEGDDLKLIAYELFAGRVGGDRVKAWKERKGDDSVFSEILTETAAWFETVLHRFEPEVVVCESGAFQVRGGQRTSQVAEVRGVLHYVTLSHSTLWKTVNPSAVKKYLTGKYRGGNKNDVQMAVYQRFGIPQLVNKGMDHICDAAACALYFKESVK